MPLLQLIEIIQLKPLHSLSKCMSRIVIQLPQSTVAFHLDLQNGCQVAFRTGVNILAFLRRTEASTKQAQVALREERKKNSFFFTLLSSGVTCILRSLCACLRNYSTTTCTRRVAVYMQLGYNGLQFYSRVRNKSKQKTC